MNETTLRACAALGGIAAGMAFIALLSVVLPAQPDEISVRFLRDGRELRQMRRALLPEDEETMPRAKGLAPICAQVRPSLLGETFFCSAFAPDNAAYTKPRFKRRDRPAAFLRGMVLR